MVGWFMMKWKEFEIKHSWSKRGIFVVVAWSVWGKLQNLSKDNRWAERDSNRAPPECKSRALSLDRPLLWVRVSCYILTTLLPWQCRKQVPPKRWLPSTKLQGVKSQKTLILIPPWQLQIVIVSSWVYKHRPITYSFQVSLWETQILNNFPTFYGTRRFTTVFTTVLSLVHILSHMNPFHTIPSLISRSISVL
jgi:hypothetical protein